MNIDEYCDAAKKAQNLKSDRQLCKSLGKCYTTVNFWRQKKSWPNDETMIDLAKLAEVDPVDALLDLNVWRSHGSAIALYTRIRKSMAGASVALFVLIAQVPSTADVQAFSGDNLLRDNTTSIYYGKYRDIEC